MAGPLKSDPGQGSVIDLPDLIQSIGQTGRSGILRVRGAGSQIGVYFQGGQVVACEDGRVSSLSRALVWTGQVQPGGYGRIGIPEPQALSDQELGDLLVEMAVVTTDGLRDAVDCFIEECLTQILSWEQVKYEMLSDIQLKGWSAFQASLGTQIPPGSLLMEGLRRLDESKRVGHLVPARWDVLVQESTSIGTLSDDERRILSAWREGRPAGAIMELSGLPPWNSGHATALLISRGLLRIADGTELVVFGDRARNQEHYRTAEGLYRRALELGANAGRIHFALGELAERRQDEQQAAADYQRSAEMLGVANPAEAVLALRSALRLGADRERCLRKLLGIYRRLGEDDDALEILFELAQLYEASDRIEEAMDVVREAQRLNADQLRCAQVLAALALLTDDQDEAILQLEQVVRAAQERESQADVDKARRQLLLLDAGRCRVALDYARDIAATGHTEEALETLRRALATEPRTSNEDLEVQLRECIAELDSDDVEVRDWLARSYQQRKDRVGAAAQLQQLAESQERRGDLDGLAETLGRILALGGDEAPTQRRLAEVENRRGREAASQAAWLAAVEYLAAEDEQGDLPMGWCEAAIEQHPCSYDLHERLAELAAVKGDNQKASRHFAAAVRLAVCMQDEDRLKRSLDRYRNLRPDSTWARLVLLELAEMYDFEGKADVLEEIVRFYIKTENIGLALRAARVRGEVADRLDYDSRSEYVELLRRAGEPQEELDEGRLLYADLCEDGDYHRAQEVLERLVASHDGNPDLLVQLAELHEALGNQFEAVGYLRRAISLMQQEERIPDAIGLCDQLQRLVPDDPEVDRARQLLDLGEAVNWSAIHEERTLAAKRRIVDEAQDRGTGSTRRETRPVSM